MYSGFHLISHIQGRCSSSLVLPAPTPIPEVGKLWPLGQIQLAMFFYGLQGKNSFYILNVGEQIFLKRIIFVICENHTKLKFQCPKMFRCNSKSNCYANFSVFTLSFFHLSLWMGNEGFLDWHWFTHHNKRTLLWTLLTMDLVRDRGPCSSSGGAHRELGTPEDPGPGVSCSVIPSPCPVLMQTSSLDLSWSLCVVCFQATKGTCLLWALGGKRRGVGCGPGPALLVPFYSGAEFWVVWKIFQLWLK